MGRHVADNVDDKKSAPHRRRGFTALASIALFALVVGLGVFGLHSMGMSTGPEPDGASDYVASMAGNDAADGEQIASLQVSSDPQYGDFETGKVLVHVDESTALDSVNSMLQGLEVARTKDVSGQDVSAGFVEVEVDATVSMSGVLSAFEDGGAERATQFRLLSCRKRSEFCFAGAGRACFRPSGPLAIGRCHGDGCRSGRDQRHCQRSRCQSGVVSRIARFV